MRRILVTVEGFSLAPEVVTDQRDPRTSQIVKSIPNGFHASNAIEGAGCARIDKRRRFIASAVQNGAFYPSLSFDLSDREARARTRSRSRPWPMRCIARRSTPRALRVGVGALRAPRRRTRAPATYQPIGATVGALSVAPGASPLAIEPEPHHPAASTLGLRRRRRAEPKPAGKLPHLAVYVRFRFVSSSPHGSRCVPRLSR